MQRIRGLIEKFPESPFGDFFFFAKYFYVAGLATLLYERTTNVRLISQEVWLSQAFKSSYDEHFSWWIIMKFKRSSNVFTWREKQRRKSNPGWMVFLGTHHLCFTPWGFGFPNSCVVVRTQVMNHVQDVPKRLPDQKFWINPWLGFGRPLNKSAWN